MKLLQEIREKKYLLNGEMTMKVVLTDPKDMVDTLGFIQSHDTLPDIPSSQGNGLLDDDDYDPSTRIRYLNPRFFICVWIYSRTTS